MDNWPDLYRSDSAVYHDPRWQRRVVGRCHPVAIVENVIELKLECGHEPLAMGDNIPAVGALCFCPTCYEERDGQNN